MTLNVLVVDDSAVMRTMIIKTLRLSGLPLSDIHEASNGEEALRLLEQQWIDLALLDINMPIMTGEEMLVRVRQNPETAALPVIVVSTEGSETRIAALRQQGAEFVHKPFTPEMLREIALSILGVNDAHHMDGGAVADSGPDL
jgi:two-component system, chemotaxis family, chemotaxis protein CheY